jgi:hypothetical protein
MKNPWGPFPVDDLDAYERRQRLNARLSAVALAWLASALMFIDETVRVRDGIIALVLGAVLGLVSGLVVNSRRPDLHDQTIAARWPPAIPLIAVGVAAVAVCFALKAVLSALGWVHEPFRVFTCGVLMGASVFGFLRAPAVARYRRRRYEADLAEIAGERPPS